MVSDETKRRELEYGTALYDFTGTATDELSFKKGDKIEIKERVSEDWLRGKHGGQEGMLPRAFVQLSKAEPGRSSFIENQSSVSGIMGCFLLLFDSRYLILPNAKRLTRTREPNPRLKNSTE